jgi:hypothetical protein
MADTGKPHHDSDFTKKDRIDAFIRLGDSSWRQMDTRRAYEWKVSFGLWTALGIMAGLLIRGEFKPPTIQAVIYAVLLAIIVYVYIFIWSAELHKRNAGNKQDAHHFWGLAIKEFEPNSIDRFEVKPASPLLKEWSHLTQILVTLTLAILAGTALFQRTSSASASNHSPVCLCTRPCSAPEVRNDQQNAGPKAK